MIPLIGDRLSDAAISDLRRPTAGRARPAQRLGPFRLFHATVIVARLSTVTDEFEVLDGGHAFRARPRGAPSPAATGRGSLFSGTESE